MAPLRGWGPKGKRLRSFAPHGHWRTLTFLGALRCHRLTAPCVFDGPINGQGFRAYVAQQLVPTLEPGDVVIMDMCGRPLRSKKNLQDGSARRRVLTCVRPLMRRVTCRGPVWESADRIHFNLARSRRSSMTWFSRSRLINRCAIPPSDLPAPRQPRDRERLRRRDRSSIDVSRCEQSPDDARHLVGQCDADQHGRLAAHELIEPGACRRSFASGPARDSARADDE